LSWGPLTIGTLLEAIRETSHQSLSAFAAKLGVSAPHLCDVEKGRRNVSIERAAKWARVLGRSETQFIKLAIQGEVDAKGLKFKVDVQAA
jgi:transcriptional regulator with XRE-family HTH domain